MRAKGDVSNEGGWVTKCVDYQGGGVVKKKTQFSVKHLFVDNRAS